MSSWKATAPARRLSMDPHWVRVPLILALLAPGLREHVDGQTPEPISTNDNRSPAGRLDNGVLSLRLELRRGVWLPEAEDGEAIPVYAFGEVGKPLQAPAPLIRVP